jgi:hypothetical protein
MLPPTPPAELIAFPKGIMGQLFWLAFSEQGKWEMLIKLQWGILDSDWLTLSLF